MPQRHRRPNPAPARRLLALVLLAASVAAWLAFSGSTAQAAAPSWSQQGVLPGLAGGRIWQVAFSPGDPKRAYAATDHGVYTSIDGGQNWSQTGLDRGRVWTVGFDPRTPTTMLAGLQSAGIRISTDSGATWSDASNGLSNRNVRCFGFSLGGVAAGTDAGVALSTDGRSWHAGGLEAYSISALGIAANAPTPVFLAGVDRGNVAAGYLWRSTGDGRWDVLSNGLPAAAIVNAIAVGPTSATVTTRPVVASTNKGTVRSGDGGTTWTASTGVPDGVFPTTATFSPLDPNVVYAGADAGGSSGGALLRSTDGGASFVAADAGLPTPGGQGAPARREVESLAIATTNPPSLLAAINPFDGGGLVYRETDTGLPSPPALVTESGAAATIPPVAATPVPTASAKAAPSGPASTPTPGALARTFGAVVHFPIPIVPEVLLVVLAGFLYLRWRRRYYVEGPP